MQPLVVRDLVLVGGGHAHVHVIRMWAMRPVHGVRVTLVSRDVETPYSGMLPGLVAGTYTSQETHIDLVRLCAWARVRLVHASATGLQLDKRCVLLDGGRPALQYDVLSLDVGITPAASHVPGAAEHAVAVKPIDGFAARWAALSKRLAANNTGGDAAPPPLRVAVVGGGAGGVELALAMASAGGGASRLHVSLVTQGELLPTHGPGARARVAAALRARHVDVHTHAAVTRVDAGAVTLSPDGATLACDACVWCTHGVAPPWLAASGIATDASGCVTVDARLRSVSHGTVFAAGDCAHLSASPRPKAGVFAVRAGPVLDANLRAALHGRRLTTWTPQRTHLGLLNLGNRHAVATWGPLACGGETPLGALLWRWKDRIDRKWMRMCVHVAVCVAGVGLCTPVMPHHRSAERITEHCCSSSTRMWHPTHTGTSICRTTCAPCRPARSSRRPRCWQPPGRTPPPPWPPAAACVAAAAAPRLGPPSCRACCASWASRMPWETMRR